MSYEIHGQCPMLVGCIILYMVPELLFLLLLLLSQYGSFTHKKHFYLFFLNHVVFVFVQMISYIHKKSLIANANCDVSGNIFPVGAVKCFVGTVLSGTH